MEIKDEPSSPQSGNQTLGVPRDITFDHDSWDSCYLLESYPDVIKDIESSLSSSNDARSTRALLGYEEDIFDGEHQLGVTANGADHREHLHIKAEAPYEGDSQLQMQTDNHFQSASSELTKSQDFPHTSMMADPVEIKADPDDIKPDPVDIKHVPAQIKPDPDESMSNRPNPDEINIGLSDPEDITGYPDEVKGIGGNVENTDSPSTADVQMGLSSQDEYDIHDGFDILDDMVVIDEDNDGDIDLDLDDESGEGESFYGSDMEADDDDGEEGTSGRGAKRKRGRTSHPDGDEDSEDSDEDEEEEGEWDSGSEDDVDALLEKGLPDEYNKQTRDQAKVRKKAGVWRKEVAVGGSLPDGLIGVKEKTVLKKRGQEPLEGLPDGWIRIAHQCGMPLYLHRPTRVCTWSRPYLLGSGSSRKHHVPVASIPCLQYRRALDNEKKPHTDESSKDMQADNSSTKMPDNLPNGMLPDQTEESESKGGKDVAMETTQTAEKKIESLRARGQRLKKGKIHICEDDSVDGKELTEYLTRLFEFEKIAIKKFKTWAARRRHTKAVKKKDRPQFPGGPKMIRCQIPGNKGREFVINAHNKTPVAILHEYSQRVMRMQTNYVFGVSSNANAPFEAYVEIQGMRYGRGEASNKRLAKAEAAKATLDILAPELVGDSDKSHNETEYFDHVAIDDARVNDLCNKAGQLTPFQVLQEYLQRSHGLTDTDLKMDIKLKNHQKSEYTLALGPHTVKGMCKNKTTGKQLGAQKLLKLLHPNLTSWGAIIKMYGKGTSEMNKIKKKMEKSVTSLADQKPRSRPNTEILNKLRKEMLKSYGKDEWLEEEMERQKNEENEHEQMDDSQKETL